MDDEEQFKGLEDGGDSEEPADKGSRTSFGEKKDSDANDDDDEVNVDEEEGEEGGSGKTLARTMNQPKISITVHKKQPSAVPVQETYDYSMLDELLGFLDQGELDLIEPILCGYFSKVVQALLGKIKGKFLEYILTHRQGDIYDKLLKGLMHHSLAQLLVELLSAKVVPQPASRGGNGGASGGLLSNNNGASRGFAFDNHDDDEGEDDDANSKNAVTPHEARMIEILNAKRQNVLATLIESLGAKNRSLENTLNAQLILLELTDNENLYGKLVEK